MLDKFAQLLFSRLKATEFYFRATYDPERDGTVSLARALGRADDALCASYMDSCAKFWGKLEKSIEACRAPGGLAKAKLAREISWHYCGMRQAWREAPEQERRFLVYARDHFEPKDFAFKTNWAGQGWEEHKERYLGYWFSDVLGAGMLALPDAGEPGWREWIGKAARLRPGAFGAALAQNYDSSGFLGLRADCPAPTAQGREALYGLAGCPGFAELLEGPCESLREAEVQIASVNGQQPGPLREAGKAVLLSKWLAHGETESLAAWARSFGPVPERIGPYPVGLLAALRPQTQQAVGWLLENGAGPGHFGARPGERIAALPGEAGRQPLAKAAKETLEGLAAKGKPADTACLMLAGAEGGAALAKLARENPVYAERIVGLWRCGAMGPMDLLESPCGFEAQSALLGVLAESGALGSQGDWTQQALDSFFKWDCRAGESQILMLEKLVQMGMFSADAEVCGSKLFGGFPERALLWPAVAFAIRADGQTKRRWSAEARGMAGLSARDREILEENELSCARLWARRDREALGVACALGSPAKKPGL